MIGIWLELTLAMNGNGKQRKGWQGMDMEEWIWNGWFWNGWFNAISFALWQPEDENRKSVACHKTSETAVSVGKDWHRSRGDEPVSKTRIWWHLDRWKTRDIESPQSSYTLHLLDGLKNWQSGKFMVFLCWGVVLSCAQCTRDTGCKKHLL